MPSPNSRTDETLTDKLQQVYRRIGEARALLSTLSRDRVETVKVKLFPKEANQEPGTRWVMVLPLGRFSMSGAIAKKNHPDLEAESMTP